MSGGAPPAPRRGSAPGQVERALGNPLELLAADHLRQRALCELLEHVAAAERPDPEAVEQIRAWLREELPAHIADEEEDLFPLLRARAAPEDEIDSALDALSRDHRATAAALAAALEAIERLLASQGPLAPEERASLAAFAESERRHLGVENAILLPLARVRLTRADLATLRRGMLQRRGLDRALER
jgi:hemerythrin-like domain-containing protein